MFFKYDHYNRLEVAQPYSDLGKGFRAKIHDPAWFLAMQWLMGEFQGENAVSPVQVAYRISEDLIAPMDGNIFYDPQNTPPEAIVESETGDWWTPGRRVRIGIEAAVFLPSLDQADQNLLLADLPAPYHHLNGRGYDGHRVYERRTELGLAGNAIFYEVPEKEPVDLWDPAELIYDADFICNGINLHMQRHSGGHVDWYSVDADKQLAVPSPLPKPSEVTATRLQYPGSPNPRWWEIEDVKVDIAGFPPDRSHFATMLLIDLIASHSDDWFTFPILAKAGNTVTLYEVQVTDSFGDKWTITPPADWSLFRVKGLADTSLVVWPTVTTPLAGTVLEEVMFGIDEDSNLMIAVERRLNGRDVPTPAHGAAEEGGDTSGHVDASQRKKYRYRPSTLVEPFWHPYIISEIRDTRYFIQGRLADLSADPPELMPAPTANLLFDSEAGPTDPVHKVVPSTIPPLGIKVERRWMLARRTDRTPVLWIQRRREPIITPPALKLRFDVAEEKEALKTA